MRSSWLSFFGACVLAAAAAWTGCSSPAGGGTGGASAGMDGTSGIGCNFVARDVTGDGKVDIFTTNKHGTFLHVQQ